MPNTEWKRAARKKLLEKQGGKCAYCGTHLTMKTTTLDHVMPIRSGGKWNEENLVGSCVKCNIKKGGVDVDMAIKVLKVSAAYGIAMPTGIVGAVRCL